MDQATHARFNEHTQQSEVSVNGGPWVNQDGYRICMSNQDKDAIDFPQHIESPDGRRFYIRKWLPSLVTGEPVTVQIEAIVYKNATASFDGCKVFGESAT